MTSNNAYTRRTMLFNIEDGLILLAILGQHLLIMRTAIISYMSQSHGDIVQFGARQKKESLRWRD